MFLPKQKVGLSFRSIFKVSKDIHAKFGGGLGHRILYGLNSCGTSIVKNKSLNLLNGKEVLNCRSTYYRKRLLLKNTCGGNLRKVLPLFGMIIRLSLVYYINTK